MRLAWAWVASKTSARGSRSNFMGLTLTSATIAALKLRKSCSNINALQPTSKGSLHTVFSPVRVTKLPLKCSDSNSIKRSSRLWIHFSFRLLKASFPSWYLTTRGKISVPLFLSIVLKRSIIQLQPLLKSTYPNAKAHHTLHISFSGRFTFPKPHSLPHSALSTILYPRIVAKHNDAEKGFFQPDFLCKKATIGIKADVICCEIEFCQSRIFFNSHIKKQPTNGHTD